MRVEDLSGDEATVYRAVAELEDGAAAPYLRDIARRGGLDLEPTRTAVHRLPGLSIAPIEISDARRGEAMGARDVMRTDCPTSAG
jgi:hypothetical protein